jgi:hypothetical protein
MTIIERLSGGDESEGEKKMRGDALWKYIVSV